MPDPYRRARKLRRCDTFLESLQLRHWCSRASYRSDLWRFEASVDAHPAGPFSFEAIHAWCRSLEPWTNDRGARVFMIVLRFLDWLAAERDIQANPLRPLLAQFSIRRHSDLAEALRTPDPITYLEEYARTRTRQGRSHLGPIIVEHVSRMRSLGYRYTGKRFFQLDRFVQMEPELAGASLSVVGAAYVAASHTIAERKNRLSTVRTLAAAMRRHDESVLVPSRDRHIARQASASARRAQILSRDQVSAAMAGTSALRTKRCRLRPKSIRLMIALGYSCGMRFGEVLRLTLANIDMSTNCIDVVGSKFFKSRRVPMSPSTTGVVARYLRDRADVDAPTEPSSPLLWDEGARRALGRSAAEYAMTATFRAAHLKPPRGTAGARFHDLRHTFVVHRLTEWYREGVAVQSRLAGLATYLGHKNIKSTLAYITMTPELLALAADRFRTYAHQQKVLPEDCHEGEDAGQAAI